MTLIQQLMSTTVGNESYGDPIIMPPVEFEVSMEELDNSAEIISEEVAYLNHLAGQQQLIASNEFLHQLQKAVQEQLDHPDIITGVGYESLCLTMETMGVDTVNMPSSIVANTNPEIMYTVAQESIADTIRSVWNSIMEFFRVVWKAIGEFISKLLGLNSGSKDTVTENTIAIKKLSNAKPREIRLSFKGNVAAFFWDTKKNGLVTDLVSELKRIENALKHGLLVELRYRINSVESDKKLLNSYLIELDNYAKQNSYKGINDDTARLTALEEALVKHATEPLKEYYIAMHGAKSLVGTYMGGFEIVSNRGIVSFEKHFVSEPEGIFEFPAFDAFNLNKVNGLLRDILFLNEEAAKLIVEFKKQSEDSLVWMNQRRKEFESNIAGNVTSARVTRRYSYALSKIDQIANGQLKAINNGFKNLTRISNYVLKVTRYTDRYVIKPNIKLLEQA
jgi:hypothetical protein